MPQNLTDAADDFPTQTAPTGLDVRNAAGITAHLQAAADRARFLKNRTDPLADLADLKAVAGMDDGAVRLVKGFGFYVFDASSVGTEVLPLVVDPSIGSGQWLHTSRLAGGDSGVALNNAAGFPVFPGAKSRVVHHAPNVFGGLKAGWSGTSAGGSPGINSPTTTQSQWFLLDQMHDGATLDQVDCVLAMPAHSGFTPTNKPYFEVLRVDVENGGGTVDSLGGNLGTALNYSAPAGQVQSFAITGIASVINRAKYLYYAEVTAENGGGYAASARYLGFRLHYSAISDLRWST